MTLQKAKSIARHLGLTLRQLCSGYYRVNFRDGNETTAYYTDNLEDAANTAVEMDRKRTFSNDCGADRTRAGRAQRVMTSLAATNKYLAQSNKTRTGGEATKKRQMQIGCLLGDAAARVSDLRNHSANPRGGEMLEKTASGVSNRSVN
jgi:hypothetical protein